jgi:putative ABC transport system ATP-binding protein
LIEPIVRLEDVRFRWPGQIRDLLHIPNLTLHRGEHLFIQGPSGSGKTTLLNLLTGIYLPTAGAIAILGTELTALSSSQRDGLRADYLGVIFQQFNLLPYLSLLENVQLPCEFSNIKKGKCGDVRTASKQLLSRLGLEDSLLNQPVSKLSVGQQQRAAVARALIGSPEIVIADEPTSALDRQNRDRFLDLLFQETKEQGSTLIFVSHDEYIARQFEHVVQLEQVNAAGNDLS